MLQRRVFDKKMTTSMNKQIVKPTDIVPPARLNELLQRRDRNGPGLIFLISHTLTMLLTGWLVYLSLRSWWVVPAMTIHGIVMVHWFAPFHECSHGTAFKSAVMNKAVGWVTGTSLFLIPVYFRYEHIAHHSYTQIVGDDPEMIPIAERLGGYLYYATAIPYFYSNLITLLRMLFGQFNTIELKFLPKREMPRVRRQAWIMAGVYVALAVGSIWLNTYVVAIYWLIPRVVGEPFMRLIRISEHTGCPRVRNILRNTRTVLTFPLFRWLNWNNAYHAEHHAIPTIPFHALSDLHQTMGSYFEEVRHGYVATQVHLIRGGREGWNAGKG